MTGPEVDYFFRCNFLEKKQFWPELGPLQATQVDQADKAEKAEKTVIRKKKSKEFDKRRPSIEKKDWDQG